MPTLLLLRHAKSDWDDPSLPDHERPLAPRGHRAVKLITQHFRDTATDVDLVLCSTARRTLETWEGVRSGLAREPEVHVEAAIYEAAVATLLGLLRGVDDRYGTVLMIGHNPGTQGLALTLTGGGSPDALARLEHGYPTAALASLAFDGTWSDLAPEAARLTDFVRPRDLAGE